MQYKAVSTKLLGPAIASNNRSQHSQILYHRIIILALTFIVYATYHASRKPLAIVNAELHKNCSAHHVNGSWTTTTPAPDQLEEDCGWAPFHEANGKKLLGMLDTIYLAMYAFGLFCMGFIAERSNLRIFLPVMMCVIGVLPILFGLAHAFHIHSLWYFIVLQLFGGFAQASGWPSVVSVVGSWFGTTKKGLILGIWNWHTSVGNIIGTVIAGSFVETNWGLSFIVPGIICIVVGLLVFILLIPKPSQVGLHVDFSQDSDEEDNNEMVEQKQNGHQNEKVNATLEIQHESAEQGEEAITVWQALFIPGVVEFAICLFFSKLVSYTFQFWLPLYLDETGHVSASTGAFRSIVFDLGGCLGSLLAGLLSDRIDASGITCIVFLVLSIPSLYSFNIWSNSSMAANQVLQFIAGACVNGPYALITTAVSANLGCKVPSKSAMATVSGIIDGTGSIGAAVGPMIASFLTGPDNQWSNVFYMCIAADVVAIVSLSRMAYFEFRRLRRHYSHKHH